MQIPILHKVAAVLVVECIEDILPFWARIGAGVVAKVPEDSREGGRVSFVILAVGASEVMYQTFASFSSDLLRSASVRSAFKAEHQQSTLFIDVDSIDAIEAALGMTGQVVPRRTTGYGLIEVGYLDPAGNIIVFAQNPTAEVST